MLVLPRHWWSNWSAQEEEEDGRKRARKLILVSVPQTCQLLGGHLRISPPFMFSLVSSLIFAVSLSMKRLPFQFTIRHVVPKKSQDTMVSYKNFLHLCGLQQRFANKVSMASTAAGQRCVVCCSKARRTFANLRHSLHFELQGAPSNLR